MSDGSHEKCWDTSLIPEQTCKTKCQKAKEAITILLHDRAPSFDDLYGLRSERLISRAMEEVTDSPRPAKAG